MLLKTWESVDKVVRKDIIISGTFCKKPTERAECKVIVENINVSRATVQDLREKFNSKILDGASEITLIIGEADCEIDRQIERAIQMMMTLEKSLVRIDIQLEDIDEHVVVEFEITLSKIELYKPIWEWTPEEKYLTTLKYKETGVNLFREGRCIDAFRRFSKACKILITLEPISDLELNKKLESDINNLRLILYNNMAGCQLTRKNYEHTISLCNKVLDKESNNVKALYRRGMAYGNLRNLEKCVADLKSAANLEPHSQIIRDQFEIYNAKLQEANKKFGNMVKRMFKI